MITLRVNTFQQIQPDFISRPKAKFLNFVKDFIEMLLCINFIMNHLAWINIFKLKVENWTCLYVDYINHSRSIDILIDYIKHSRRLDILIVISSTAQVTHLLAELTIESNILWVRIRRFFLLVVRIPCKSPGLPSKRLGSTW